MKPILLSLAIALLMVGCNGMPGAYSGELKPPLEEQVVEDYPPANPNP